MRISQGVQKWLQAFCHVLVIIFSVLMIRYGINLIGVGAKRTAVSIALNYGVAGNSRCLLYYSIGQPEKHEQLLTKSTGQAKKFFPQFMQSAQISCGR